jgi:hypothetical protein
VIMFLNEVRRRRSRRSFLVWGLATLTAAILVGAASAAVPSQDATVRPDPLVSAAPLGGQVVVNIYVQDVQNLYGADIRLGFDPAVLEVQDANPSASGVQILPLDGFLKPDFVVRNKACNAVDPGDPECSVAGVIRYALTQVNPSVPASGSGALAAVTFKRLSPDVTTLKILTHELSDRYGVTIPSTTQDGRVDLGELQNLYLPLVELAH